MTILATGGTGLVGPRLLKRFVEAGVECRALVRPGKELPAGVTAVEGDILRPDSLAAAVEGMSAIVHLAALFRTRDEDQIWKVNLEGTRNLIGAVQEHAPDARLLMASTSNVYDPDISHPGRENGEVRPTLAYPASKVEAEKELRKSGLNWAVLRLPYIYGDKDGHRWRRASSRPEPACVRVPVPRRSEDGSRQRRPGRRLRSYGLRACEG